MPALGRALSELLDHDGSPDRAAHEIAETPALIAEARVVLPALKTAATAKAETDGVRKVIAKRFALYPQPQRSDEEWAGWWADYLETLAGVSLASLEAAMRAYVARPDSEFMPKPGKLLDLAQTTPCRSLQRYYRAKRAIEIADRPRPPPMPDGDPEPGARVDPAEVRTMLAEFEAKSVTTAMKTKPELPSIAGKADEGGLTKEMRALMARRQGLGG